MTTRVRFRKKAEEDIFKAARYYESKSKSLGVQFLSRIKDIVELIREHPKMFPICCAPFRRALLKQFPYALYYEYSDQQILVSAVYHQHQNIVEARDLE